MLPIRAVGMRMAIVGAALAASACTTPDAELERRVKAEIASEAPPEQVKVTTTRRIVTLEGVVESPAQASRIEDAARRVPGILGVDNRLTPKKPVTITGAPPAPATPSLPPDQPR